jgi:simple sugar transport system permease protein
MAIGISSVLQSSAATATPLLLAALGENVVQRAGVVNVGLEGMMLVGAFFAVVGARQSNTHLTGSPYAGILLAVVAAVLLAALFALFVLKLTANQVVIGVVLNLLAVGLTGTLYRALFGLTGAFLAATTSALPGLPWLFGQNLLPPLALLAVPVLALFLFRTRAGLELRACGEHPAAAEAAGVSVVRVRAAALLFGGAMAGLAGAYLSIGENHTFVDNMSAGRGFIALAIVTSGRWNPWGCMAMAVLFGLAQALQFLLQARGLHVPYQLFVALPYVVTLLVLSIGGRWAAAPAALGQPYRRA